VSKVFIIAEIGVNHNGSKDIAKKMIDLAAESGVDAVKFQTGIPELVMSRYAQKAKYQLENTRNNGEGQLEMVKKLELPIDAYKEFKIYAEQRGLRFMSTPFDLKSVQYLDSIGMETWKIPSGEITNLPYLIAVGRIKKPIILSTGMSTLQEIQEAVRILKKEGCSDIFLLHCNTQYPTPYEDVNLRAMDTIQKATGLPVGYSDHTLGIEVPVAAVAMGAVIIEKHFTLDRTLSGPDHKASLEPAELKAMVRAIRNIEIALGDGVKRVTPSECENMEIARKSIIASRWIRRGEPFCEDNITTKRPGSGISPMKWFDVLGKPAPRDFEEDELIEL